MVFGPRRAPQHLELAEARGEEGGRGGRRRTRRRGRRKRSCTFVRIQIPSPGRWGNRKFLSKDNKHIGRWPQLWNLNGILAAKREMLEHAKSKRTHRFNMFFNLLDKHVKHFFCLWKDWAATIFMFLWRHRMQKLLLFVFVQWQKFTQLQSAHHSFLALSSLGTIRYRLWLANQISCCSVFICLFGCWMPLPRNGSAACHCT